MGEEEEGESRPEDRETFRWPPPMGDLYQQEQLYLLPRGAQDGATHLVGVRAIPVGDNFCLPMTH